jgi:hypothetical protein
MPPNTNNQPPVANAGIDVEITLPVNTVTLPEKEQTVTVRLVGYSWAQLSGPNVDSLPPICPTLFSELIAGTYTFELTVTDDDGDTGKDTVSLLVNPAADKKNLQPRKSQTYRCYLP